MTRFGLSPVLILLSVLLIGVDRESAVSCESCSLEIGDTLLNYLSARSGIKVIK